MGEALDGERLQQRAAEMILGTPDLTDELSDEPARVLLDWGLDQARGVAREAAALPAAAAALAADGPGEALAERVSPVRRVIKLVNDLAADRHDLEPEVVVEELAYVLDLAHKLPQPPPPPGETALAELAAWQVDMDDGAFVWAVLSLLQPESA